MELAFSVPFVTIPVKRTIDMANGAIANVNLGAVALAGAIAFGFAIVIPGIVLLLSKKQNYKPAGPQNDQHNHYRSESNDLFQTNT